MIAADCGPANINDIVADDKRHYFTIEGDRAGQKKGAYCLKIDNDWACGWFVNYRIGETISWHSRSNKKLTPEEKAAYKKRIAEEKKRKEEEREILAREAAIKANEIWKNASREGLHEYLVNKKITQLHGARISDGALIVAAFKDGKVSTIQTIQPDGEKRFLLDGEKQGAYFPIANSGEDLSVVCICEGFATGASIREATGLPVVVAFDANNLSPVAKIIRVKYPQSEIIFAADNDLYTVSNKFRPKDINPKELPAMSPLWEDWREHGYLINTGMDKASQAAVSIGGARVIIPRFIPSEHKYTDMNDLYVSEGIDAVKEAFKKPDVLKPIAEPDALPEWHNDIPLPEDAEAQAQVQLYVKQEKRAEVTNWKERLHYKENGSLKGNSLQNLIIFLQNEKTINNLFCWDEFCCKKMVYQCPPWDNPAKFKPHPLTDNDTTMLTAYMERFGFSMGSAVVKDALDAAVKNNPRNPAQEYFNSLVWDGVNRLDTWLQTYCGAINEPAAYVSAIGRKWLCAAVKRVFEPGAKFDHMLVLEGAQGIGKSTILRELATIHGHAYFDDTVSVSDITDPRTVPKFQGVLIVEIAELAGIRRHDVDSLKKSITTPNDTIVRKYENEPTTYPRKFVFAGTINPLDGYLSDPTGNRRFWPANTTKIDVPGLAKVKEQIWAEAVVAMRDGESLYLDNEISGIATDVTISRLVEHPWFSDLRRLTNGKDTIGKDDIWDHLLISDRTKRTTGASSEISKIMTHLGFKNKRIRVGEDMREYRWVRDIGQVEVEF